MGDYFGHWLEMGRRLGDKAPKIFNVNWFRTDDEGHFLWPGFGDNMRVVMWILGRCDGKLDARETPIGYEPYAGDIDLTGLDMTEADVENLLTVDKGLWQEEAAGIREFFQKFGDRLPKELEKQLETLENNVK